jgi:pyruvate/2-oxoglutarate dehydrogenase complex dihydrolipoamide acyltransferase (E2) component
MSDIARHVVELTPGRRARLNTMDLSGPQHRMYGLLEVDVTLAKHDDVDVGMLIEHRTGQLLPWPLSRLVKVLISAAARHDPTTVVAMSGTTFVSAVGMFGEGHGGLAVSPTPHSLSLFVGGIVRKPAVVGDRVEPRDILDLTAMFDHDVVDGAPATRFVRRLVELIERGPAS